MRNFLGYGSILSGEAREAKLSARSVRIFNMIGLVLGGTIMAATFYLLIGRPQVGDLQTWLNTLISAIFTFCTIGILVAFCVVGVLRVKAQTGHTLLKTVGEVALKVFLYILFPAAIITAVLYFWLVPR